MKKKFAVLSTILCLFPILFLCHVPHVDAQQVFLSSNITYPQQIKVGETAYIEVQIQAIMPDNAIPSVKISTSTSPQEDFLLIQGYPASAIRFKKAGDYAFTVNSGFILQED